VSSKCSDLTLEAGRVLCDSKLGKLYCVA